MAAGRTVERRPPRALAARVLPAARRPARCRSSSTSTASATAGASPRAGSSPSSTVRRSSTCQASFQVLEDGPEHCDAMPDVPDAGDAARRAAARRRRRARRRSTGRAPRPVAPASTAVSIGDPCRRAALDAAGRATRPGRVDPRRGTSARRPARCTRAWSRTRPTSCCSAPRRCRTARRGARRRRLHDGEPRPRDVVPPPVSAPTSGCCTTATARRPARRAGFARGRDLPRRRHAGVSVAQEGSGAGRVAIAAR